MNTKTKTLIKKTEYFSSKEEAEKIIFTEEKKDKKDYESVHLNLKTNELFVENVEVNSFDIKISAFSNKETKICLYNVNSDSFYLKSYSILSLSCDSFERILTIDSIVKSLELKNFNSICVLAKNKSKIEKIEAESGKKFSIISDSYNLEVEKVKINNVEKVNLSAFRKLSKNFDFYVRNVDYLCLSVDVLKMLDKENSIQVKELEIVAKSENEKNIIEEKKNKNVFSAEKILISLKKEKN